jgi:hypothetical protein
MARTEQTVKKIAKKEPARCSPTPEAQQQAVQSIEAPLPPYEETRHEVYEEDTFLDSDDGSESELGEVSEEEEDVSRGARERVGMGFAAMLERGRNIQAMADEANAMSESRNKRGSKEMDEEGEDEDEEGEEEEEEAPIEPISGPANRPAQQGPAHYGKRHSGHNVQRDYTISPSIPSGKEDKDYDPKGKRKSGGKSKQPRKKRVSTPTKTSEGRVTKKPKASPQTLLMGSMKIGIATQVRNYFWN